MLSPRLQKIARYIISGSTAALVNVGILFVLVDFVHIHYLSASIVSYLLALVVSFSLQKFWTFRESASGAVHTQFALYTVITLVNLGINTALMYAFVSVLGIWYLLAQIISGLLIAVMSYFVYQRFVFRKSL
jgi:putative flippase GtrA